MVKNIHQELVNIMQFSVFQATENENFLQPVKNIHQELVKNYAISSISGP